MFRFLFRLAAMVALAVAVIMAVLDATRTVAASNLVMTPLKVSWSAVSPDTLARTEAFIREKAGAAAWDSVIDKVLDLPGFVLFAMLAFLLYAVAYRRQRRTGNFAVGA